MNQEKIGKLIARLRKSKGLTQRELGEMVGVGFRAVSKWETGLTSPDISIINDLSKILEISADELLKGEVNRKEVSPNTNIQNKNIIYMIIVALAIIVLTLITIILNVNKSYIYELVTRDKQYYVEGQIMVKRNNLSIKIDKLGFEDTSFRQTLIRNYQYEIKSKNTLIFGYGYVPIEETLPSPITVEKWGNEFKINYAGKTRINKRTLIKNGLYLKIIFIDNHDKQIIKSIKLKLKKPQINHST